MAKAKDSKGALEVALTAAGAFVPGLAAVKDLVHQFQVERRERVLDEFLKVALGSSPSPVEQENFEKALRSEPLCFAAFKKAFEDDEEEKAWVYAALFRGFASGKVLEWRRIYYLRACRDSTAREVKYMVEYGRLWITPLDVAPGWDSTPLAVLAAGESTFPNLFRVLVDNDFLRRRSGNRPPTPTADGTLQTLLQILTEGTDRKHEETDRTRTPGE